MKDYLPLLLLSGLSILVIIAIIYSVHKIKLSLLEKYQEFFNKLHNFQQEQQDKFVNLNEKIQQNQVVMFNNNQSSLQNQIDEKFTQVHKRELDHISHLQTTLKDSISRQEKSLEESFNKLSETTANSLDKISNIKAVPPQLT